MTLTADRKSSASERAGMAWWNGLSQPERRRWLTIADTSVVAEAYACYLALLQAFESAHEENRKVRDLFGDEWDFGMLLP